MSVDLRERLRRALGPSPSRTTDDRTSFAPRPREAHLFSPLGVETLVPGAIWENQAGTCFVGERAYALGHVHGGEPLDGFLALADRALACLARAPGLPPLDRREVVFLDTETTGLAGGTGTYVFLVGLGYFEDDRFVLRQYFMRHHAEEPAMLLALGELFPRFRAVVSFNGKAFDLPLLQTRFTTNRQRWSLRADPHLDLLFPSRRFWRDRLDSCALGTIERAVLGHTRRRDVPSWMIPQLYFQYVRDGDARPMAQVFAHNLHDILSLVALACRLGRLLGDPLETAADPEDLLAVARIYEDLGHWEEACACYERALASARSAPLRTEIASRLAQLCKRVGRPERAVDLWRRLILSDGAAWSPYVELAKHYEHRARDYAAAIAIVEQALTILELRELHHRPRAALERADLERRLARLLTKQRRVADPPADHFDRSPASAGATAGQLRIASTRNQR